MTSDNRVMNFVARHGMFYSRMLSVAGRNIQLCSERFKLSVSKLIDLKCNLHVIDSVIIPQCCIGVLLYGNSC